MNQHHFHDALIFLCHFLAKTAKIQVFLGLCGSKLNVFAIFLSETKRMLMSQWAVKSVINQENNQ